MAKFFKSLFGSSETDEASNSLSKADQKNFDIFKYDGIRAQRMGQLPYAIKCFTEALNIQEDFETMGHLVGAYVAAHQLEEALTLSYRMIELETEHIPTYLTHIQVLQLAEHWDESAGACRHVIALDGNNQAAWFLMGKAKKETGDLSGAIEDLGKCLECKEDFVGAYLLRGEALLAMKHYEEALNDVKKAAELAPEEESTYLLSGKIHEAMSDFAAAADDYKQVLELNPFNTDAALLSGTLLMNSGKLDEAITFFDDAIELKPDFIIAYQERARAKELKGDSTGAQEDRKKAQELSSTDEVEEQPTGFDNMYKGGIY